MRRPVCVAWSPKKLEIQECFCHPSDFRHNVCTIDTSRVCIMPQIFQALFEVKTMLNDSRGILIDWNPYLDTACGTISTVVCDPEGKEVVEIILSSSGLSGVLSPSIAKLTTLQRLFLDDNDITGGIPHEIGNLSSLTTLKLQNNQFNGSISDSFGRLSELQNLDLSQNLLSGNIPISLSNIPSLNYINLAYNNLSGEIPKQLHASLYNYTGNHLNCGPHLMPCEGNINNTGGSRKSTIKVVLGSIGGAIVVVAMCVLILRRMPCRHDLFFDFPDEHALSLDLGGTQQFSLEPRDFNIENFLGKGSFAEVYKGVLPGQDNKVVAIKKLAEGENLVDDMDFKREAEVISVAVHRNLLKLIGYCMAPTGRFLVYPFMEKSLSSSLEGSGPDEPTLDWTRRMKIVLGVAHGLEYLHDNCDPPIIHGNIKAANVLLDGNFEAVLGDFGLAKLMDQGKEIATREIQGTVGYMAPEYRSTGKASKKTDIYGYGVLVLEIVLGKSPDFHVNMSEEMKTKFEKYWKEVHGLMSVATVLDPRYKLHMLQALFGSLYGFEHATTEVEKIRKLMGDLLLEYQASDGGVGTSESQVGRSVSTQGGAAVDEMENIFKQYMSSKPVTSASRVRTELDLYLEEEIIHRPEGLDIINWWQFGGIKYPTLRRMAHDILAIPVTTVASESAFSTSGRILSAHRCSLAPNMTEALMCMQAWSRADMLGDCNSTLFADFETVLKDDTEMMEVDDQSILTEA